MPLEKNRELELEITALSSDGNGVGRHEGQAVFVPAAAVGDRLRVKITKAAARRAYGRIERVLAPGPGRVEPDCPVSRSCGGCDFRHLSYEAELCAKQLFVSDALRRLGGLQADVERILPSPETFGYRNKVQYPVAAFGGGLCYGFYAKRSHRVVPFRQCLLQPPLLNAIAGRMADMLAEYGAAAYGESDRKGLVRHLYLRQSGQTGKVLAAVVATSLNVPWAAAFAGRLAGAFPEIGTVVLNKNSEDTNVVCGAQSAVLWGDGTLKDTLCGVPVRLDIHTFSQVNRLAAARLFETAAALAAPTAADTLLDLYCGTGVIGLSMAHRCGRLIGADTVPQAIESARASAREMGAVHAAFHAADAQSMAERLAAEGARIDIAVIDPPRKGAGDAALNALAAVAPKRIVMISCNPATLARDLARLAGLGYRVSTVQPADMFPRTRHVECAALLLRQKNPR